MIGAGFFWLEGIVEKPDKLKKKNEDELLCKVNEMIGIVLEGLGSQYNCFIESEISLKILPRKPMQVN